MRGTLRKHRIEGKWRLQLYLGTDPHTGKEFRPSRIISAPWTREGRQAAEAELNRWALETDPQPHDLTMRGLVSRWRTHINLSPSTTGTYLMHAATIEHHLGGLPVRAITASRLDRFYSTLTAGGATPSKVLAVHRVTSVILTHGVRWGLLAANPARDASPPSPPRSEIRPATEEQIAAAVAATTKEPWVTFLRTAVTTGARRGELCGLKPGDLNGNQLTIQRGIVWDKATRTVVVKPTKTGRARTITVDPTTQAMLTQLGEGREWIFGGLEPLRPSTVGTWWQRLKKTTGIDCRFHDLRHRVATVLLANGVDVVTVAGRLGHRNPAVTLDTYAHFVPARDGVAADILGRY